MRAFLIIWCLYLGAQASAQAASDDIINFVRYSPALSSSGQPTAEQLSALRDDGLQRVVYIAYSDHERSLAHEDRLAKKLGLEYIHIPVEWNAPLASDFALFAGVVNQDTTKSTLLHCQLNYRATAFAMLYRVIYQDISVAQAKAEMNAVWTPNETWTSFILDVLKQADIDPQCAGCDWTPAKQGG